MLRVIINSSLAFIPYIIKLPMCLHFRNFSLTFTANKHFVCLTSHYSKLVSLPLPFVITACCSPDMLTKNVDFLKSLPCSKT